MDVHYAGRDYGAGDDLSGCWKEHSHEIKNAQKSADEAISKGAKIYMMHGFKRFPFWGGAVFGATVVIIATLMLVWILNLNLRLGLEGKSYQGIDRAATVLVPIFAAVIAYLGIMKQVRLQHLLSERANAIATVIGCFRDAEIAEDEYKKKDIPRSEGKTQEWVALEFAVLRAQLYVSDDGFKKLEGLINAEKRGPDNDQFLRDFWDDMRAEVRRPNQ